MIMKGLYSYANYYESPLANRDASIMRLFDLLPLCLTAFFRE